MSEYGIFESLLMEGEQKERYLANKHGKKADELKAERERKERRYGDGYAGKAGGDSRKHPDFMKYAFSDREKANNEKTDKARDYARNAASNYGRNRIDGKQSGKSGIGDGYSDDARDAANRKYRRTHKNESALPFV